MLTPPQAEILESGLLTSGFNCVIQMPTGSGKTWLAEQAIHNTLEAGNRAIYLTPLKALAEELITKWQQKFPSPVGIFTGDYGSNSQSYPVPFQKAKVMIMTPERLDACTRYWQNHWNWIPEVDLIVADELHLLGEKLRGARLEGALSRMMRLNPFLRILGLSATLGNRHELADWLQGVEYASTWRPVQLNWRAIKYRKADQKPQMLLREIKNTLANGGKSLVFVLSRRRAESLSTFLQQNGIRALHHHAGLDQATRRSTETNFRNDQTDVLVTTATLEMGLNLPVRQVILYDLQSFNGDDFRPLSTNTVWQRVGRAGRPGFDNTGEAVLFYPGWETGARDYSLGRFETIYSSFANPKALIEQIAVEVTSGLCRNRKQLKQVFFQSLAARQHILPDVDSLVFDMKRAGMLCDEIGESGKGLKITRLGRIAVRHFIAPETVILFQSILKNYTTLSFFDLLMVIASTTDSEPILPVDFEELEHLEYQVQNEISFLLQEGSTYLVQLFGLTGKRLLASFKMAVALREWTRLSEIDKVSDQQNCYSFELVRLKENAERLLFAMSSILMKDDSNIEDAMDEKRAPLREKIHALTRMIAQGLNEETVTLTSLKGIGAKTAKRLYLNEIPDIEVLAASTPQELTQIPRISLKRAKHWIDEANQLLSSHSAFYFREDGPKVKIVTPDWPPEVDPYRLRRALDLKVENSEAGVYLVSGGLEPHLVIIRNNEMNCDCLDHQRGYICKHILALRLHRGDLQLKKLVQMVKQSNKSSSLNLFDLWFSQT